MLFRLADGTHIEILRSSYMTDTEYYAAVMKATAK